MANIAQNEVLLIFKDGLSIEQKEKVIHYIAENLVYDEIYNDVDIREEDNSVELSYGTKWSEQKEILQEICNKFDVKIIGVCYELGCGYVSSFEMGKL